MKLSKVMEKHITFTITPTMVSEIAKYKMALINKKIENIDFMSSYYYGVHVIRFTDNDRDNLFLYFNIDRERLDADVDKISGIERSWKVSADPFNIMLVYVAHLAFKSSLPNNLKEQLVTDLLFILQFKILTSIYYHYFKYPVDKNIAQQIYEKLPNSSLIKRYGSNFAVLEHRANMIFKSKTLHKMIKRCEGTEYNYIVSDYSNALRSMLKVFYRILIDTLESNERRSTLSIVSDGENGEYIDDIKDAHKEYAEIIMNKLLYKDEFVDKKILRIIGELFPKIDIKKMERVLVAIHDESFEDKGKVLKLVELIVEVSIKYLYVNKKLYPPYTDRMVLILKYLKGLWSASNLRDKRTKEVKDLLLNITTDTLKSKTKHINLSIGIMIAVYIFLLSITKNRYS